MLDITLNKNTAERYKPQKKQLLCKKKKRKSLRNGLIIQERFYSGGKEQSQFLECSILSFSFLAKHGSDANEGKVEEASPLQAKQDGGSC